MIFPHGMHLKDFYVHVLPNDPKRGHKDDFKNIYPHWTQGARVHPSYKVVNVHEQKERKIYPFEDLHPNLVCDLTINEQMDAILNLKRARGTKDS